MSWLDRFLFRDKKRPGQWRPVQKSKSDVAVGDGAFLNVSSNSYRSLIEAAVSDAERIASDITDKARSEANAESERVIARAKLEAEELKGKAEAVAREEAGNIISDAEKTAAGIEAEAKRRALQFLVQQTQIIEKEIAQEYRLALAKLSADLHSLSTESEEVNTQLRRKMAMLATNKSLALEDAKTALLGTSETMTPQLAAPSGRDGKTANRVETNAIRSVLRREQSTGEKASKQPREETSIAASTREPLSRKELDVPDVDAGEMVSGVEDAPAATVPERKFFSFSFSFRGKKGKPPPVVAEVEEEHTETVVTPPVAEFPPAATNPPPAPAPVEVRASEPEPPTAQTEKISLSHNEITPPALLDVDSQAQYSGEVELMILPPVDLKLVTQLYNFLQTIPELKVLYTRGSWDQGTTIVVVLEKPFALVKTVTAIPGISVTVGIMEKDAAAGGKTISLLRRKERPVKRLGLLLKETVDAPKA